MRVSWSRDGAVLRLLLRLDADEGLSGVGQGGRHIELITNSCRIELPSPIEEPHPDIMALAAYTVVHPWVGGGIDFGAPVSPSFARVLEAEFGHVVTPVDETLGPRRGGPTVGLSFSGGADSVAVSTVIDDASPHIHFRRVRHERLPDRATHLRVDVAQELVLRMGKRGLNVLIVRSDLEFMCSPFPQFPVWTTVAIGPILLADAFDLGAIGFGTNLGSRYLGNGYGYRPGPAQDRWAAIFEVVGVPQLRPACGMSEIVTYRLSNESRLGDLSRSCMLGSLSGPCHACTKCIRKELIAAAVDGHPLDDHLLRKLKRHPDVIDKFLEGPPFYFQHILEYGLARTKGIDSTFLRRLDGVLAPTVDGTDWLNRYYTPALADNVPAHWSDPVRSRITSAVDLMRPEDEVVVRGWNPLERVVQPAAGS